MKRPNDSEEVDFVECKSCDSPCYNFEIDPRRGVILQALCAVCGNDDTAEFRIPDESEE